MVGPIMEMNRSEDVLAATAEEVSKLSSQILSYLASGKHDQPNFNSNSPKVPDTFEYEQLRHQLNDAAQDLIHLVNGPAHVFRRFCFSHCDLAACQVALNKGYFTVIPDDKVGMSAAEIAYETNMDVDRTSRFMKMLTTHRIFEEVNGKFRHTANSAFLKTYIFRSMCEMTTDDNFRAASETSNWVNANPYKSGRESNSFYQRFGKNYFQVLQEQPQKAARLSKAMTSWTEVNDSFVVLRDSFDWAGLGTAKVVDVGGSNGHISVALAQVGEPFPWFKSTTDISKAFPSLTFTVQDVSEHQLSSAQITDPGIERRIAFQQCNFFDPQPIHDARVYFCRQCFHNHNDEDAVTMLKAYIPALEHRAEGDEATLIINELILPECTDQHVTRSEENEHRQLDILMLMMVGAKERSVSDWKKLLQIASERFEIVESVYNPKGAGLVVIKLKTSQNS